MHPVTIRTSTPTRISLLGGGSDLDIFSSTNGGAVLSLTINLRIDNHIYLYNTHDLKTQFPMQCDEGLYNKIIKEYGLNDTVIMTHSRFDGYVGAGLGTSGAFTVAMVGALEKYNKRSIDPYLIAEKAYAMEVNTYGKYGGRQDHYASVFGGLNYILFQDNIVVLSERDKLIKFLYPYMCLFYIGNTRKSEKIQEKYKIMDKMKVENLKAIKSLVSKGIIALERKNSKAFGDIMQESWELKRSQAGVTDNYIDTCYKTGMDLGAYAGKLLGAGGGGYFLFLIEPDKRQKLITRMEQNHIQYIDFEPDMNGLSMRYL